MSATARVTGDAARPTRRRQAADTGIAVVAERGLRGLTHRAVDEQGGFPAGTTSSCFRTRRALVAGILERLHELDTELVAALPETWWHSRDGAVEAIAHLLAAWLGPLRERARARLELYLVMAGDEDLGALMEAASATFVDSATAGMRAVGASDPFLAGRLFVALVDGFVYDALARPHEVDERWIQAAAVAVVDALAPHLAPGGVP